MYWLNAFSEMLPKLEAEEALLGISLTAIGSGVARKGPAASFLESLRSQAAAGEPVRHLAPAERLARARLAGIRVSHG